MFFGGGGLKKVKDGRELLFVVREGKGCMLMGAKYVWELYSELN